MKEECGVAAVYALKDGRPDPGRDVSQLVPRLLMDMQMRGELSAGITSYDPSRRNILATHKRLGTVHEAFRLGVPQKARQVFQRCRGCAAIGHVRYATSGLEDRRYAQPFERRHGRKYKWFSFGFNGQLSNYTPLMQRLKEEKGYHMILNTDSEIIMHYLSRELMGDKKRPFSEVWRNLSREFDGAYSVVLLNADGDLVVARDPRGMKPLCYAVSGNLFAAGSESAALSNLGYEQVYSLEPGCFVLVNHNGVETGRFADSPGRSTCFFEWVYFANVSSTIDGAPVYLARHRFGKALSEGEELSGTDDLVVVPVPDTAKAAADGLGFQLGVPVVEGLIRNRYVGRTFIKGEPRNASVTLKYTPIAEVLRGKRVILVEDSIVRGTTLRYLIEHMRRRGSPKEIHVRVAAPPILYPCFYGIDMSTVGELFARRHVPGIEGDELPRDKLEEMAGELGADSLRYLPLSRVPPGIGVDRKDLCMACVEGSYPTPYGTYLHEKAEENYVKAGACGERTYE